MKRPPTSQEAFVRYCRRKGWVKPRQPEAPVNKHNPTSYIAGMRAAFRALGLTAHGHIPRKQSRPELAALSGKKYHRFYMRLFRRGTLKARPYHPRPELSGLHGRKYSTEYMRIRRQEAA